MSIPYVCTTCRLSLRQRARIQCLRGTRSSAFSVSAAPQQGRDDSIGSPNARRRDQGLDVERRHRRVIVGQEKEVGRYSHASVLKPEHVLEQIGKDGEHTREKMRLPPHVFAKIARIEKLAEEGKGDEELWSELRAVLRDHGSTDAEMRGLLQFGRLVATYRGLVDHSCRRNATVRASEVLAVAPLFPPYCVPGSAWSSALWNATYALLEQVNPGEQSARHGGDIDDVQTTMAGKADDLLGELMRLWNLAFATRLRRHSALPSTGSYTASFTSSTPLDWSFLPSLSTLHDTLQLPISRKSCSFDEALEMLLPPVSAVRRVPLASLPAKPPSTPLRVDFASAALVTLYILRTKRPWREAYSPVLNLLEGIKRLAPATSVPSLLSAHAINRKYGPAVRERYAHVIESLSLRLPRLDNRLSSPIRNSETSSTEQLDPASITKTAWLEGTPTPGQDPASSLGPPVDAVSSIVNLYSPLSHSSFQSALPTHDSTTDRFVSLCTRRLNQATEKQKPALALKIRNDIFALDSQSSSPPLPDQLYEHLMLTLLSLRLPKDAIGAWNHFIQLGRQPTTKTYTVMMKGAQFVRDANGMEGFWQRMRAAALQPDQFSWSVRIFGLIAAKRVHDGLQALAAMGKEWTDAAEAEYAARAAEQTGQALGQKTSRMAQKASLAELATLFKGDVNGVSRPNIVVMNSAISALGARGQEHIPPVIAWGRSFGIEPDVTTYNALINLSMRKGEGENAVAILKRMQDRGLQANSTTWTVLLTALFEGGSLERLSSAEQQERILAFITSLEAVNAAGIDVKGYATIIDRMLKYYSNTSAAQAVLQHMISKGMMPTAHIYTILATSYFQREPQPDFGAVEALWAHAKAQDGGRGAKLDDVFYDRMIEGYATHHAATGIQPAFDFLLRMRSTGRNPSWRALEMVVRALSERRDWMRLDTVVQDVRRWETDGAGKLHVGEKEFGRRGFWEFVIGTGILEREGITRVEQVLRPSGMGKKGKESVLMRDEVLG